MIHCRKCYGAWLDHQRMSIGMDHGMKLCMDEWHIRKATQRNSRPSQTYGPRGTWETTAAKHQRSKHHSKTCSIRPFLCSRSARRRCFRIDLESFALCDFDLVLLRSASKACSPVQMPDNRKTPVQLMIVAHVQAQHVTFHDMKADIRKNPT